MGASSVSFTVQNASLTMLKEELKSKIRWDNQRFCNGYGNFSSCYIPSRGFLMDDLVKNRKVKLEKKSLRDQPDKETKFENNKVVAHNAIFDDPNLEKAEFRAVPINFVGYIGYSLGVITTTTRFNRKPIHVGNSEFKNITELKKYCKNNSRFLKNNFGEVIYQDYEQVGRIGIKKQRIFKTKPTKESKTYPYVEECFDYLVGVMRPE